MASILGLLNYAMLGGMVFGAGVAGYNTSQNSCDAVRHAVDTLKQAKTLKDKWDQAIIDTKTLDMTLLNEITQNYTQIEYNQNQLALIQKKARTNKLVIVVLGFVAIIILFFYLLFKYYNSNIKKMMIMTTTTMAKKS